MTYTCIQTQPKDLEKKVNALAAQGWKVVAQSEAIWPIKSCFGLSSTADSIINVTMGKE